MAWRSAGNAMTSPRIELLHVPDCPRVDRVRDMLEACLDETGINAHVHERDGEYPSPTLLIDGVDVLTGKPAETGASCRLQLPAKRQIRDALTRSP